MGQSGRVLAGRYRLLTRLGRGGFGEVWRAEDARLAREVAVKTLTLPIAEDTERRFAREARALARLNHPNVVAVYDFGADDGIGYLVMQLLSGPSLAALSTANGPLSVDEALEYAEQAAAGLAAAHRAGIVHRDVSPSNLILDHDGVVKVVDFGVARLREASVALTVAGTVFATPGYVSPEQAAGRPAGPQSDLYSLGCVLYALIAGEPPFTGEHAMGVIQQHLTSAPPPLAGRRPDVPASVEAVISALLAKDPGDRPASADDVAGDLAAIRSRVRGGAEQTVATRRLASTHTDAPPSGGPVTAVTRPAAEAMGIGATAHARRQGARWGWIAVGLAVVALGALLASRLAGGGGAAPGKAGTTGHTGTATTPSHRQAATAATTGTRASPTALNTPAQAIAAARVAVTRALTSGQLDRAAAEDLNHRLDDISQALQHPNPHDAAGKVSDLLRHLADLVRAGQVTAIGGSRISAPLNRAAALLPAAHSQPPGQDGKHKGHHGGDHGQGGDKNG